MDYGLCMDYDQAGHLVRACTKQSLKLSNILGGQATYVESKPEATGEPKNISTINPFPGELTA